MASGDDRAVGSDEMSGVGSEEEQHSSSRSDWGVRGFQHTQCTCNLAAMGLAQM